MKVTRDTNDLGKMAVVILLAILFSPPFFIWADSRSVNDVENRLVRLETKVQLKFDEIEKALVLARELLEKDRIFEKERVDIRWAGNTEYYRRIEKVEQTMATRDQLDEIKRLVYIGLGILMTIQFVIVVFFKMKINGGPRAK